MENTDYNITLFEACEYLNKSRKTVSRYVRKGKLSPLKIESKQGTLEYRFRKADLDALRDALEVPHALADETGHVRQDRTDETGHPSRESLTTKTNSYIKTDETGHVRQDTPGETGQGQALAENTLLTILQTQLSIKDSQIAVLNGQIQQLIERDRETNILLKNLQDKVLLLGPPKVYDVQSRKRVDLVRRLVLWAVLIIVWALVILLKFY